MEGVGAVDLELLVGGDAGNIEECCKQLFKQGWVFVNLTPKLKEMRSYDTHFIQYFTKTKKEKKVKHTEFFGKKKFLDGAVYGYNMQTDFKEGLRLLTGGRLNEKWIPKDCSSRIQNLVKELDEIMLKILKVLSQPAFKGNKDLNEVPLLINSPQTTLDLKDKNFAMLDIVYYKNHNPYSKTEVSVAEHYDPGLLSLNILSTQPGLQFKNAQGGWVDVPGDVGVLWAGQLAARLSENQVKPGIHRVVSPPDFQTAYTPRLSIWIEVCDLSQDLSLSIPAMEKVSALPPKTHYQNINPSPPSSNKKGKVSKNPMNSIPTKEGESLESALRRASRQYGVPMTKTITHYCPVCLKTVRNLLSHFQEAHENVPQTIEESPIGLPQ